MACGGAGRVVRAAHSQRGEEEGRGGGGRTREGGDRLTQGAIEPPRSMWAAGVVLVVQLSAAAEAKAAATAPQKGAHRHHPPPPPPAPESRQQRQRTGKEAEDAHANGEPPVRGRLGGRTGGQRCATNATCMAAHVPPSAAPTPPTRSAETRDACLSFDRWESTLVYL